MASENVVRVPSFSMCLLQQIQCKAIYLIYYGSGVSEYLCYTQETGFLFIYLFISSSYHANLKTECSPCTNK